MSEDASDEIYIKVHSAEKEVLVAACDCCLMGKKFQEGQLQLEIEPGFFGLEKATSEDLENAMRDATIANFIGHCAVECAIRLGYVDRENVLTIAGIPCAQMVVM